MSKSPSTPEQEAPAAPGATIFPPSAPNQTVLPPYQAAQFAPGPTGFTQYGPPLVNSFSGPGPLLYQSDHQFQHPGFPMGTNPYYAPATSGSYGGFTMPSYHNFQPFHPPPGYPPVNWQPAIPSYHPPPIFNDRRSVSGPSRFRSPSPTIGVSGAEDPSDFPQLKGWLEGLDQDHLRGRWGHQFSQLSARFELDGLTSLLGLEGMSVDTLINKTGISEEAAQRLLRFAREDIAEIRANRPSHAKRVRYSN